MCCYAEHAFGPANRPSFGAMIKVSCHSPQPLSQTDQGIVKFPHRINLEL
jgi:hypothetical protein